MKLVGIIDMHIHIHIQIYVMWLFLDRDVRKINQLQLTMHGLENSLFYYKKQNAITIQNSITNAKQSERRNYGVNKVLHYEYSTEELNFLF